MLNPRSPAYRAATHGLLRRWLGPYEDGEITQASAIQVPRVGATLATGQRISTTAQQHMILVNCRDLVEVSANTTVTIGDNDPTTTDANVDLITGTIHVEVGKRTPGQTFLIGAPYLVAIVKGIKFDVSTSNEASAVSVTEGVVAVSAIASGESIDVTVGNTAIVGRRTGGAPTLALTPPGGASSTIGIDQNLDSASANIGNSAGDGSEDLGSGGSGSSGSGLGDRSVGGALGGALGGNK